MRAAYAAIAVLTVLPGALPGAARAEPPGVTDFGPQARLMFRVAACGGDDAIPERFSARAIAAHCRDMAEIYGSYKKAWADPAQAFIAGLRPKDLPRVVVYPFGGGDLSSALAVFPDADEVTTISLEAAGDVRAIDRIKHDQLAADLDTITHELERLYYAAHSTTKSLQTASHSELPGTIMMALAGLAVHDMEPAWIRYFDIDPDGKLHYLDDDELEERAAKLAQRGEVKPKRVPHFWYEQTSAFANVEIGYYPRAELDHGDKPHYRTYRHIVANLDDAHLKADDRVLRHLRAKGKVAVMTKAASFLLWYDDFAKIRDYLIANTAWMISDASGIPPSYAEPAGLEQITYGDFTGPYFIIDAKNTREEFVKLWKSQPHRPLPFRFGYPDADKHNHLMITRPKSRT